MFAKVGWLIDNIDMWKITIYFYHCFHEEEAKKAPVCNDQTYSFSKAIDHILKNLKKSLDMTVKNQQKVYLFVAQNITCYVTQSNLCSVAWWSWGEILPTWPRSFSAAVQRPDEYRKTAVSCRPLLRRSHHLCQGEGERQGSAWQGSYHHQWEAAGVLKEDDDRIWSQSYLHEQGWLRGNNYIPQE